ncbi:MAG: NlpC/P60 family protein [Clostridium sp.]
MIKKKVAVILLLASIISPVKANAIELSKDKSITVEDAYQEKTLKENRKVSFSSNSIITLNKDKTISGSIGDGKNIKKVTLYINGDKFQEVLVNCDDEVYNFSLNVNYKKAIEKAEATVEVEYNDGTVIKGNQTLETENMEVLGTVDSLRNGQILTSDKIQVRGWAAGRGGVKNIKIYYNDKLVIDSIANERRSDIDTVYPSYGESNWGYDYYIPRDNSVSVHKIKIIATMEDGTSDYWNRTLNSNSLPMRGTIDSPQNGSEITGKYLEVRGWHLSSSKAKKVEVFINGKLMGEVTSNTSRPDVAQAFPNYDNENSGFDGKINISNESNGEKTLRVLVTNEDGTTDDFIRKITIKKPEEKPIRACLDTPKNGSVISEKYLNIRGWHLSSSKMKKVEVFINGKLMGEVTPNTSRPDVAQAFPDYNNENSGFDGNINISSESNGEKTLKILITNEDGTTDDFIRKITIKKPDEKPIRACLDTPKNGSDVSGMYLNIRGWHLSSSKMKKVEVFIDGKSMGQVTPNTSRPDVAQVFPEYNNENSGFDGKINIANESSGAKTLRIVITNEDGTTDDFVRKINIKRLDNISHLDEPKIDYNYYDDSITLRGWVLSGYGVKGIHVYIDDKFYKAISVNEYRPDVAKVYPSYNEENSGFSVTIPMSGLETGQHQVRLYVITGNDKTFLPTIISGEDKKPKNSISFYNNNLNVNSYTYYGGGGWRRTVLDHAFGMRGVPYYLGGNWNNAKYVTYSGGSYHFTPVSELPKTGAVPGYGLDCAGFVQRCYKMAGISIGKTTWEILPQVKRTYTPQPGDLYFKNDLDHVGIYLKDNEDGTFTYIDCNQTWEGELKENKVRGRVEVRREKKVKDCVFYTPY